MSGCSCNSAVSFEKVCFSYGNNNIFSNVSFSICERDFVAIVGPNGGGKTTVLKLMLGLLKADSGNISIMGYQSGIKTELIGYVSQSSEHDPAFPVSVIDVVLMGRLTPGYCHYSAEDRDIAVDALRQVAMEHYSNKHFFELSGGQRQRVLIARALAGKPRLLLLDEATSNLDIESEESLYELLTELNRNLTVIMVSHDLGFVSRKVRTVMCVRDGIRVHPTSELTGELVSEIYGGNMKMVRHDHRCSIEGHEDGCRVHKSSLSVEKKDSHRQSPKGR